MQSEAEFNPLAQNHKDPKRGAMPPKSINSRLKESIAIRMIAEQDLNRNSALDRRFEPIASSILKPANIMILNSVVAWEQ